MKPDFSFRPPKNFGPILQFFGKKFAKMGPKIFGGLNKKLSCAAAAKRIMGKYES